MNALIILADLGRMKAYRITRDELEPGTSPVFANVADVDLANQHSKVSERVTDKAGRFAYGSGSKSVGERQSEQDEAEARQLNGIAGAIRRAAGTGREDIYLAAPKEIIADLLDELGTGVGRRVRKQLSLNLVKAPKLDLLERFGIR
ncbi:host attachment protein [Haloferula sp. A504]|uniref:host attachment protein n=1 Tax=Haloferula sp. A504 TaxID=3373601 RepID=UPI0031C6CE18|nr:host attachment protein [Verrucomicrobiaceae bacterium E54]